jgi:hypothetical protein
MVWNKEQGGLSEGVVPLILRLGRWTLRRVDSTTMAYNKKCIQEIILVGELVIMNIQVLSVAGYQT